MANYQTGDDRGKYTPVQLKHEQVDRMTGEVTYVHVAVVYYGRISTGYLLRYDTGCFTVVQKEDIIWPEQLQKKLFPQSA